MRHDRCVIAVLEIFLGSRQVKELAYIYRIEVRNIIEAVDSVEIVLIIQSPAIIDVRKPVPLFHYIGNNIERDLIIPALAAELGAVL